MTLDGRTPRRRWQRSEMATGDGHRNTQRPKTSFGWIFFLEKCVFLSGPGLNEGERDGIHKPCKTQRMVYV